MLAKAKECWEQEQEEREAEKSRYLAERIPTLQTRGLSLSALQVSLAGPGLVLLDRGPCQGLGEGPEHGPGSQEREAPLPASHPCPPGPVPGPARQGGGGGRGEI